jgi:hypothetical protein
MDVDTSNYRSKLALPTFVDAKNASMDPCVDRPWKGTPMEPGAELVAIKSVEQTIQGDRTL